jgi:hypothetical protein
MDKRIVSSWFGWFLSLFAVTALPYLFGWLSAPKDLYYTGLMLDVPDHAQYWSWVTSSRHGLWIDNRMTPEPNPPIFLNVMMWLLAGIQNMTGLSFPLLFQVWRALGTLVVVYATLTFVRAMLDSRLERRTAAVMALLGSGFGWLLVMAKYATGSDDVIWPNAVFTIEPNTWLSVLGYPYIALAQGLVVLTILWTFQASRPRSSPVLFGAAAGAAALLASFHAYDLITVYAVLAMFGAITTIRTRTLPWRLIVAAGGVVAVSLPVAVYYRTLTTSDLLWRNILAQYVNAGVWTPSPPGVLILMGAPLLLAVYGCRRQDWSDARTQLLTGWMVVSAVLVYLPTVYQIKLFTGWQFPLAVLASGAWHRDVEPRIASAGGPAHRRLLATALLAFLILPTSLYLYAWRFIDLRRHQQPYYLHRDELGALTWLAAHAGANDVVLAPLEIGQFVPNYGDARAYVAHWAMTNRFFERRDNSLRFFDPAQTDAWRAELLRREGISLVLAPGGSGDPARYDPATSPLFDPVFTTERAKVFRIRRAKVDSFR